MLLYTLSNTTGQAAYDEAVAVSTMQGVMNRQVPRLFVLNRSYHRPAFWLDIMSRDKRWLQGVPRIPISSFEQLCRHAKPYLKGIVIWDPAVPATLNVACTVAGVRDAVVFSPEMAARWTSALRLPVIEDFRGRFTGSETGSAKNDAYRWAIRQYLAKGLCSSKLLCLYHDAWRARASGDLSYAVVRDWPVKRRAFVFDLSPWGDETPADDRHQKLGLDLETYKSILSHTLRHSAGRHMTELAGFFQFHKYSNMPDNPSRHDPVPTEWQTVWLISPYNCYQNTATELCYNQSFHSHAPLEPLRQRKPPASRLEPKAYVAILMADYDSAYPLYHFLPDKWSDRHRGAIPLTWGVNPNLLETYPDIISWYYETASSNDCFVADASAAGYMNPNRVQTKYLPLFVRHNQRFYRMADMSISGMVLDWDEPTAAVKNAFAQFSPGGFATIVMDMHHGKGKHPKPHVWKGMPVMQLHNNADTPDPEASARAMANTLRTFQAGQPGFYCFRRVWMSPSDIRATISALRRLEPDMPIEIVSVPVLMRLFKEYMRKQKPSTNQQ